MGKSLYELLELEENATPNGIKSAYLRLKNQYEQYLPPNNPQHISAIQFQAIGEAYGVLSEPKRRELYDQRLITERQRSYLAESERKAFPFFKLVSCVVLIAVALAGYQHYRHRQAEEARELKRLQLEQEQARLRQEELKLQAENVRREQEALRAQQQENYQRERLIQQARNESRQYAADVERMEEKERREQRELLGFEGERRRYERPIGPTYIRR